MPGSPPWVVDIALLAFAQRYANTTLRRDIVILFGENPYLRDGSAGIARRLGRSPHPVARELEDLRLLGLLQRSRLSPDMVYWLTDEAELRAGLEHFLQAQRPAG